MYSCCTHQPGERNVLVVDFDVESLANMDSITSTMGLERRSSVPPLKLRPRKPSDRPCSHQLVDDPADLTIVAFDYGVEQGMSRSIARLMGYGAQVLGQAGAAKRKTGLQIVRREVSLVSWQKMFITAWLSTPTSLQMFPTSFANVIFTA